MDEQVNIGHSAYHKRRRHHYRRQTLGLGPSKSLDHEQQQIDHIGPLQRSARTAHPVDRGEDIFAKQKLHLHQTDLKQSNQQQQQQISASNLFSGDGVGGSPTDVASADSHQADLGEPRLTMLEAPREPFTVLDQQNNIQHRNHHQSHHSTYLTSVSPSSSSNLAEFQQIPNNQLEQMPSNNNHNNNTIATTTTSKTSQIMQSQPPGSNNWPNNDRLAAPGNAQHPNQYQNQQLLLTFLYGSSFLLLIILGISIYNWFFTKNKRSPVASCGKFYRNRAWGFHEETSFARGLRGFIFKNGPSKSKANNELTQTTTRLANDTDTIGNTELELDSMIAASRDESRSASRRMVIFRKGVAKSPLVVALKSATKPKITLATKRVRKFIDEEAEEIRLNAESLTATAKTYREEDDLRSHPNRVAAFVLFVVSQLSRSIIDYKTKATNIADEDTTTNAGNDLADKSRKCSSDVTSAFVTSRASTANSKKLETIPEVADHRDDQQHLPDDHRESANLLAASATANNPNRLSPLLMNQQQQQQNAQSDAYSSVSACSLFSSSSPIETSIGATGGCNCLLGIQQQQSDYLMASSNSDRQAERSKSQGNSPCGQEAPANSCTNTGAPRPCLNRATNLQASSGCYVMTRQANARACCSASPSAMDQSQARFVDQYGQVQNNQCQDSNSGRQQVYHHNNNNNNNNNYQLQQQDNTIEQHSSDHHLAKSAKCNNCIPFGHPWLAQQQQPSYLKRNYENYYDDEQSDCYSSLTAASLADMELGFQDPQQQPRQHLPNMSFVLKPNIDPSSGFQQHQQHQQHQLHLHHHGYHYQNQHHNHHRQQQQQQCHVTAPPPSPQLRHCQDVTRWLGHNGNNCDCSPSANHHLPQHLQAKQQAAPDQLQPAAPMAILVQQPSQASRSPTPSPCQLAALGHATSSASEAEAEAEAEMSHVNSPTASLLPDQVPLQPQQQINNNNNINNNNSSQIQLLHPRRTSIAGDRISSRLAQSGLLGASSGLQHNHFLHRASIASSDGSQWLHTNCGQQLARSSADQTSPTHHFMASDQARLLAFQQQHQQYYQQHQLGRHQQQQQPLLGCNPSAGSLFQYSPSQQQHHHHQHQQHQQQQHQYANELLMQHDQCYLAGGQPSDCSSSLASSLYDPASYYCGSNYTGSGGFPPTQSLGKSTCSSSGGSSSGIGFSTNGSACTNAPSSATSFVPDSGLQQQANWNFDNLSMVGSASSAHHNLAGAQYVRPSQQQQQFSNLDLQQHHFCSLQYGQQQPTSNQAEMPARYIDQGQAQSYNFNQAFASCAAQPMLVMMSHAYGDPRRLPGGQPEVPPSGPMCCSSRKFSLPTQLESHAAKRYSKSDNQAQTAELLFKQNRLPGRAASGAQAQARNQQQPATQFESPVKMAQNQNQNQNQRQQQQQQPAMEENSESRRSSQTITRQSSFWLEDEDNNSMGSLSSLTNAVMNLQADEVMQNEDQDDTRQQQQQQQTESHHLLSTESSIDSVKLRPVANDAPPIQDSFDTAPAGSGKPDDRLDGDTCLGASSDSPGNNNKDGHRDRRAGSDRLGRANNPRRFKHRLSSSSTNSSTGSSPSPDFGRPSERVLALASKSSSISKRHLFSRFRARHQARNLAPSLSLAHSEPSTSTTLEPVPAANQHGEAGCSTPSTPTSLKTKGEGSKFANNFDNQKQKQQQTASEFTKIPDQDTPTDLTTPSAGNSCEQDDVDGDFPTVFPQRTIPDLNSASLERQCRDLWKLRATLHDDNCAGDDWENYHQRLNRRYDSGYKSIEDQMSYSLEGGSFGIPPLALVNQLPSSRQNSDESTPSVHESKPVSSRPPSGCSGFINPESALNSNPQVTREHSKSPVDVGGNDEFKDSSAD